MLPDGWKKEKLGVVAEFQRGFDLPQSQRSEGSVPIISSSGVSGSHDTFKALAPGIVTGRYGSIGDVFYVEEAYWPLNTALWVKDFHGNYPKYLYYLLSNFDFSKFSDKTGVPGVNRNDLHAVNVLVPPLPEQKKIAAILSTWDRAIEGTEKLLANSQQQKKALMQQLLTGKKRLPGFSGEWKKVSLEKTGKIVSGGTPDTTVPAYWDGDVLWLTPTDVTSLRGKYVDDTKRKITQTGIKDSATTLLPAGSLLVCTRATIGYMAIAKKAITTNQGFKNIVFNKLFLPEFVYYFLCTQRHEMQRLASGSTFAEISKKDFCKIHISAPTLPEQKAIAAVLTTADEEITALESDLSRLRQEKKALMQQLLTGKASREGRLKNVNSQDI